MCGAVVAERPAHRVDPGRNCRFRHDQPAPDPPQEVVLADHAVAVLDEKGQQVEDLGFQVDKLGAATQFAALDVEPVVAKR